ncbi:hypothetical protein CWE15_03605 [Aliidiomarina taiwanensis]|uniref:Gamma-glutamylcyclotransferase family protein n=1 Tax=Aliidiomarina taiwanensis TaxID=946228 RepID=A0A432XAC9_9GAMM|nr:gamma-glutamylcyclotransferase family protein [Aliidiomarina taiwanensis]RUO44266.1 hypothetical protein CWE15_03605 [Aliidiomarina taiwanensis]
MASLSLLFTYGSLKKEGSNHELIAGANYLGRFFTKENYVLLPGPGFPYLLKPDQFPERPALKVSGECHLINSKMLEATDHLEANGIFYQREEINVLSQATAEEQVAWAYFLRDVKFADAESFATDISKVFNSRTQKYEWRC